MCIRDRVNERAFSGPVVVREMASLSAVLLNTFALWQYAHVLCAALVSGGFIVAGVGAYYVLARRDLEYGRRFVRAGVFFGLFFSLVTVFPTGDRNGADVTKYQPIKLAAMEGLFESEKAAPLAIIGMPESKERKLLDPILVPDILSFLAYGNIDANVKGLNEYKTVLWPPVELTYYAYHVMVGLGTIFIAVLGVACLLYTSRCV